MSVRRAGGPGVVPESERRRGAMWRHHRHPTSGRPPITRGCRHPNPAPLCDRSPSCHLTSPPYVALPIRSTPSRVRVRFGLLPVNGFVVRRLVTVRQPKHLAVWCYSAGRKTRVSLAPHRARSARPSSVSLSPLAWKAGRRVAYYVPTDSIATAAARVHNWKVNRENKENLPSSSK